VDTQARAVIVVRVTATVRFLGHATLVIDLDGTRVITDPVLRPLIPGLVHRHPLRDDTLIAGVQAILLSHLHHDHCDVPSVRRLEGNARLIGPTGSALVFRSEATVCEIEAGQSVQVGNVRVVATHAVHDGYRRPFGPNGGALGFVLEGSRRIYFAGDTALFPELADLGPIDLALLPVAGWGPRLGPGHMDARQAVEALGLIRPRAALPIHWGSLVPVGLHLRDWSYLSRPPHEFAQLAGLVHPDINVTVLEPGQALEL
jgi:L-ascorbate metabolism protein UlaG (beta-lactamase superfamily)